MAGDEDLLSRISALVDEEHTIERDAGSGPADEDRQQRLHDIEVALDQCWDLLRQRRARRSAGENPAQAEARPVGTVEGYQQ